MLVVCLFFLLGKDLHCDKMKMAFSALASIFKPCGDEAQALFGSAIDCSL